MHYMNDSVVTRELGETLDTLRTQLGTATARVVRPRSARIVYRGVHAPIPSCRILDDPLPRPFPYTSANSGPYHWAEFGQQNAKVRRLVTERNMTFLDVHGQTSMRPGGHMPGRVDCAHYCMPGPIDEWLRLLLALLT